MKRGSIDKGFSTVTSNIIPWEGSNLPCIGLCKGDMVSDVVYKVANELCKIKKELDLEDLDLKCVIDICLSCPDPEKTLKTVLQLIINKVCTLEELINNFTPGQSSFDEKIITVASCFLPMQNSEGDSISKLPHSDYTRVIANKVCSILTSINSLDLRLDATELDITILYNSIANLGELPKISPTCITPTNSPISLDVAVTLIEQQFCAIKGALGTSDKLIQGVGKQPDNLSELPRLSGNGTMSSITGWVQQPSNVADTLPNLWLTVDDIRGALKTVLDNCCKVDCDSIKIDFDVVLNDDGKPVLLFASKTRIPEGFEDCGGLGTKVTVTDSKGVEYYTYVKISEYATIIEGFVMEGFIGPSLSSAVTFDMEACMTNGSLTCQKCINKTIELGSGCQYCEISVYGSHSGDINGELVIIYE